MRRLPILFQLKKERHFRIILKFLILDRWPYLEKILLLLLLYKRVGYEASVINVLLQSNIPGCSPPDGSHLIFTKRNRSAVNNTDMIFVFDWDGVASAARKSISAQTVKTYSSMFIIHIILSCNGHSYPRTYKCVPTKF